IWVSAVNSRFGRILLSWGSPPLAKSVLVTVMALLSRVFLLVIMHKITLPCRCSGATTSAGRRLLVLRSERGKGRTTTSPFTNRPMLHPLLVCPTPWPGLVPRRTWWRPLPPLYVVGHGEQTDVCAVLPGRRDSRHKG